MQWYIKTLSILAVILLDIPLSQAADTTSTSCETQINCSITTGNSTTTTTTGTRDDTVSSDRGGSGITTTTTTTNSFGSLGSSGTGVYEQAQQAQTQATIAMVAGLALAATGIPRCGHPGGFSRCIMGIAGLAAAVAANGAAGKAQDLKDQLGGGSVGTPSTSTDGPASTTGDTAAVASQIEQLKADYAKKGYKINPDGSTTLPNGKSIDSSFSAASMGAAGISASDINQIATDIDGMKKKIGENAGGATSIASADRGNGMMQGQIGSGPGDTSKSGNGSAALEGSSIDRNPAAWAGFYKQFGDSNIGVSQSDIFLLIENRVEKERKIMGQ